MSENPQTLPVRAFNDLRHELRIESLLPEVGRVALASLKVLGPQQEDLDAVWPEADDLRPLPVHVREGVDDEIRVICQRLTREARVQPSFKQGLAKTDGVPARGRQAAVQEDRVDAAGVVVGVTNWIRQRRQVGKHPDIEDALAEVSIDRLLVPVGTAQVVVVRLAERRHEEGTGQVHGAARGRRIGVHETPAFDDERALDED